MVVLEACRDELFGRVYDPTARRKHVQIHFFFFQAEDGIRDYKVTGVQTCALPISPPNSTVAAPSRCPETKGNAVTEADPSHLVDSLTLEQKVQLLTGKDFWST